MKLAASISDRALPLPRNSILQETKVPDAVSATLEDAPLRVPTFLAGTRQVIADYLELTKPRISLLVLFTVGVGAIWAGNVVSFWPLLHAVLGTALVAAGASALNQVMERYSDARMQRTAQRPLPTTRIRPRDALLFGFILALLGLAYLWLALAQPWAALLAGLTFVGYVGVYTPLKKYTILNTLVGAIPGAIPPLIGWMAMQHSGNDVSSLLTLPKALPLFGILFFWQIPHFLAIAWIYREQYANARLRMLPVMDATGRLTAVCMVSFCVVLLLVSASPAWVRPVGPFYGVGAFVLGLGFLATTILFARQPTFQNARVVLRASLVYLPALLALLLFPPTGEKSWWSSLQEPPRKRSPWLLPEKVAPAKPAKRGNAEAEAWPGTRTAVRRGVRGSTTTTSPSEGDLPSRAPAARPQKDSRCERSESLSGAARVFLAQRESFWRSESLSGAARVLTSPRARPRRKWVSSVAPRALGGSFLAISPASLARELEKADSLDLRN